MGKHISIIAAITTVLLGCMAPVEVDENAWTNQAGAEENTMGLVPVGPAPGGPFSTILCPDDGNPATAEDHRREVSALLRNDELQGVDIADLQNDKVDRAGDTMTDSLIVNASTTNNDAVIGTGDGDGFGVKGVGGATGGGGRFEGTGNGSMGVSAVGGPSGGPGIVATGGAGGLAAEFYPGTSPTATVPQMGEYLEGFLHIAGAQPNSTVDPGANNALHGANIPKAWVTFDDTYAILDGYNIASITHVAGSIYAVAFVRPMANANYGVKIHVHGAPGYSGAHNGTKTTTGFQFVLFKTDTLALGFGTATDAYIEIMGRQ